jgi:hypothetical protein
MARVAGGLGAFLALMVSAGLSPASAEEWVARHGASYEWDARWDVQQEPSGVWVGIIDFVHAGGPCSGRTNQVLTYETRAVIVGTDFFARRTMANVICTMHGTIRAIEVRGFELCSSLNAPVPFVLRFEPPERR